MQYLVTFDVRIKGLLSTGSSSNTLLVSANSFDGAKSKIKSYYKKEFPTLEPINFTNKTLL